MYHRVHAIGDSHVLHMGGLFQVHHICDSQLQGATAHNLIEPESSTDSCNKVKEILSTLDPEHDIILLSFGEVDCRLHIRNGFMVKATIERYTQAIREISEAGFRVIVHKVIGAVPQDNSHRVEDYPDQQTRGGLVLAFNSALKDWCDRNLIEFLDINTHDEHGVLYPILCDDDVHLNDKAVPLYIAWARGANLGEQYRKVVYCSRPMVHFGRVAAEALGWPLYVECPIGDDVDVVYIVGMYDLPYYTVTLRNTRRAKKRIIQWCGADTKYADKEYLPEAKHFSAAPCYTDNLIRAGITDVEPLMLPIAYQPEVTPLPEQPTVTSYLGANPLTYGGDYIEALMEALPDVRFQTYQLGTYSPEQMHEVMANTTVQLQLGDGNGGCSLREALQAGRTAIGTLDYEGVVPFDPYDFPTLIRRVRAALRRTEPDYETAAKWRLYNDVEYFVSKVEEAAR